MTPNLEAVYYESKILKSISSECTMLDLVNIMIQKYNINASQYIINRSDDFTIKEEALKAIGIPTHMLIKDFKLRIEIDYISMDDPIRGRASLELRERHRERIIENQQNVEYHTDLINLKEARMASIRQSISESPANDTNTNRTLLSDLQREIYKHKRQIVQLNRTINADERAIANINIPQVILVSSSIKIDYIVESLKQILYTEKKSTKAAT